MVSISKMTLSYENVCHPNKAGRNLDVVNRIQMFSKNKRKKYSKKLLGKHQMDGFLVDFRHTSRVALLLFKGSRCLLYVYVFQGMGKLS